MLAHDRSMREIENADQKFCKKESLNKSVMGCGVAIYFHIGTNKKDPRRDGYPLCDDQEDYVSAGTQPTKDE